MPSGPIALCRKSIETNPREKSKPRSLNSNAPLSPREFRARPSFFRERQFFSKSPTHLAPSARSRHPPSSKVSRHGLPPASDKATHRDLTPSGPIAALARSRTLSVCDPPTAGASDFADAAVRFAFPAKRSTCRGAAVALTAVATAATPRSPIRLPSSWISVKHAWSRMDGASRTAPSAPISFRESPSRFSLVHLFSAETTKGQHLSPPALPPISSVFNEFGTFTSTDSKPCPPSSEFVTDNTVNVENTAHEDRSSAKTSPPSPPKQAPFRHRFLIRQSVFWCRSIASASATAPGTPNAANLGGVRSTVSLPVSNWEGTPLTAG